MTEHRLLVAMTRLLIRLVERMEAMSLDLTKLSAEQAHLDASIKRLTDAFDAATSVGAAVEAMAQATVDSVVADLKNKAEAIDAKVPAPAA